MLEMMIPLMVLARSVDAARATARILLVFPVQVRIPFK